MSYDEEEDFDGGFRTEIDSDEDELEPKEEGAVNDLRFDEETDNDPESRYS